MYQYGGTFGPAKNPKFRVNINPEEEHMLVCPVVKKFSYQQGIIMMNKCHWLIQLFKKVEYLAFKYLKDQCSQLTVSQKSNSTQLN